MAWHRENPDQAVDHLTAPPFGLPAVPSYVRWQSLGGRALAGDERTGQTVLFNHECLPIFDAVAASGGLGQAAATNGRRLGVSDDSSTAFAAAIGPAITGIRRASTAAYCASRPGDQRPVLCGPPGVGAKAKPSSSWTKRCS